MTGLGRAFIGAALGAVITLVAHPVSRPYLVSAFREVAIGPQESLPGAVPAGTRLMDARTLSDTSIWMQVACDRLQGSGSLSRAELVDCLDATRTASHNEPDNAFWRQMEAVFLWEQGNRQEALDVLRKAINCTYWRDKQSDRLRTMQIGIQTQFGSEQSWQAGRVYWYRSISPAKQIASTERKILDMVSLDDDNGRSIRYMILKNAALMRESAQSVEVGDLGWALVELACQPSGTRTGAPPHRLILRRDTFVRQLAAANHLAYAQSAQAEFKNNERWAALFSNPQSNNFVTTLCYQSVVTSSLPGAFVLSSGIGLLLWGLGYLLQRYEFLQATLRFPMIIVVALGLTFVTFAVTQLPLAAIAIGACAGIAGLSPKNERRSPPESLGPLFALITQVLAFAFLVLVTAYFVLGTTAAKQVLDSLMMSDERQLSRQAFLGLSMLMLSVLLLAAPMWAFAQRIRTSVVFEHGLRDFGAVVAVLGLVLGVVSCPVVIFWDRDLSSSLNKIVANEPAYYYRER